MLLTTEERVQIILLAASGRSHREIAARFNALNPKLKPLSHVTVGTLLAELKESGIFLDRTHPPSQPDNVNSPTATHETSVDNSAMAQETGKGYRYAVVSIRGECCDQIQELLTNNGYSDFLLLNNLSEHPDFDLSVSRNEEEEKEKEPILQSETSLASSSVAAEPVDVPEYFAEVSATDLLGQADVVDASSSFSASGVPAAPLDNNCEQLKRNDSEHVEAGRKRRYSDSSVEEVEAGSSSGDANRLKCESKTGYVICELCKNMIRASRFSNLSSHARRHAAIKRYNCLYCDLQHNEHAKIRIHMSNVHGDPRSEAIDNTTPTVQKTWDFLVRQCFPNCFSKSTVTPQPEHLPSIMEDPRLQINKKYLFMCDICGFQAADPWKVRSHISTHDEPANKSEATNATSTPPQAENLEKDDKADAIDDDIVEITNEKPTEAEPAGSETCNGDDPLELFATVKKDVGDVGLTKRDVENAADLQQLNCRLCERLFDGTELTTLVMHAKAHYHVKQFECHQCGFGSNTRSLVRRHIYSQHRRGHTDIVEHNDENIRKAWTQVVRTCFPNLAELLEKKEAASIVTNGKEMEVI